MHTIIFAALVTVAASMPSYIAVPADQIAFVDLRNLHLRRVPRQTLTPPPPPPPQLPQALYSQDYQPIPLQYQTLPQQQAVALAPVNEPESPARLIRVQQEPAEAANLASAQYNERPPDFGEYVDFGAHTGDNGAFGWYADYPINNHDSNLGY